MAWQDVQSNLIQQQKKAFICWQAAFHSNWAHIKQSFSYYYSFIGLWCKQWGRTGRGGDETVSHSAIKNLAACSFQPLHWMRSRKEGTTATTEPQNEAGDFTKWRRHRTPKEPKLRKPTELNVFKCSDSVLPRPLKQDTLPVIVRLSTELMQMICSKDLAIDLFILRI